MDVKKLWPWGLGIAAGLYLVTRGSSGNSTSFDAGQYMAAMSANAAQINQQNQNAAIAQAQLNAQQTALDNQQQLAMMEAETQRRNVTLAGIANYNASIGDLAGKSASAVAQLISAQLELPARAMQSASAENQAALSSAAAVASTGVMAMPANIAAGAKLLSSTFEPINYMSQGLGVAGGTLQKAGAAALNAVVQTGSTAASTAAQASAAAAQAAAQANARATEAWSNVATTALIAYGGI